MSHLDLSDDLLPPSYSSHSDNSAPPSPSASLPPPNPPPRSSSSHISPAEIQETLRSLQVLQEALQSLLVQQRQAQLQQPPAYHSIVRPSSSSSPPAAFRLSDEPIIPLCSHYCPGGVLCREPATGRCCICDAQLCDNHSYDRPNASEEEMAVYCERDWSIVDTLVQTNARRTRVLGLAFVIVGCIVGLSIWAAFGG